MSRKSTTLSQACEGMIRYKQATSKLTDFENYAGFENRWSRELDQISRMANDEGDGRFYYTGMAQAFLLDRLSPDWKPGAFDENVSLEDLLGAAIQATK